MILTSEYQFVGCSNYVPSNTDVCNYYILLYAKAVENMSTGRHTVHIKQRLACDKGYSFYDYHTRSSISVDDTNIIPWEWKRTPNTQWNFTTIVEDGISYPSWIDFRECSIEIYVGYGTQKDIKIDSKWDFGSDSTANYVPRSYWAANTNVTVTLPMIVGASQPSVSADSVNMGERLVISTNRIPGSGLTHSLEFVFGNTSGVIAQAVDDSAEWYPDIELARQIPDAVSGTAIITCATYAGETLIGTQQTTVVLKVPEKVVPDVSATWEDISGAYGKVGIYVKGISALKVEITGIGAYGSRPISSAVSLNGKSYSSGTITVAGELSLIVYVTDSRGRTGSMAYTVNVADYSPPSLKVTASRCTSDGTADDTGDHAKITITGHITQVNSSNNGQLLLTYGIEPVTEEFAAGDIFYQEVVPADVNTTMTITAELADKLVKATRTMVLSTGYATLDLLAGGKGISFGKAATREGFDCAMPAYFSGGLYGISPDGTVDSKSIFERMAAVEQALVNL